jgi:sortase A
MEIIAAARPGRAGLFALIVLLGGAGLACFGSGVYIYAKAGLAQVLLHSAWVRTLESGTAAKPWPWADTYPVARLIAPAQDTDMLVLSGASGRTLAFGPGHLSGSANPGEPGNSVITAHRDTHFRFLQRLASGDTLVVEGRNGTRRHFLVRTTYVADFRALNIPRDTPQPTLTLVTCFPFDAINPGGPLRYVVVAEATSQESVAAAALSRDVGGSRRPHGRRSAAGDGRTAVVPVAHRDMAAGPIDLLFGDFVAFRGRRG